MALYKLIYKQRALLRDGIVEASTMPVATELAARWCRDNNAKFITLRDPVLIREQPAEKLPPGVNPAKK